MKDLFRIVRHRFLKNNKKAVSTLAIIVTFVMVYTLIMPAVALERKAAENEPGIALEETVSGDAMAEAEPASLEAEALPAEESETESESVVEEESAAEEIETESEAPAAAPAEEDSNAAAAADTSAAEQTVSTSADQETSQAADVTENTQTETEVVPSASDAGKTDAEEGMPAQKFEQIVKFNEIVDEDGNTVEKQVKVKIDAEENVFPAGTVMKAEVVLTNIDPQRLQDMEDAVEAAVKKAAGESGLNADDTRVVQYQAIDINFFNKEGLKIQPAKKVEVRITSDKIREIENPVLVHVNENDKTGEIKNADVIEKKDVSIIDEKPDTVENNENTMLFKASRFSPFVIVESETVDENGNAVKGLQGEYGNGVVDNSVTDDETSNNVAEDGSGVLMADGSDYNVTVSYDANANIPENAELDIKEIKEASRTYQNYMEEAKDALEDKDAFTEINYAKFFDISIVSDGKVVTPEAEVDVDIAYKNSEEIEEGTVVKALQFGEGTPAVNEDAFVYGDETHIDGVQMKAVEIPVTAVVGTETLTGKYITAEGDTYTVTVTYGPEAEIPEGATLEVSEIANGDKDYTDYVEKAAKAFADGKDVPFVNAARLFDISILADGKEVEPKAPVEVKIAYANAENLNESSEVGAVHFKEGFLKTKAEVLDVNVQGEEGKVDGVTFKTDSFSVYAVVIIDKEAGTFVVEDENYKITVNYTKEARIPIGTTLTVEQITPENDLFWEFKDKTIEKINENVVLPKTEDISDPRKGITDIAFFDISLKYDGEEIEPEVPLGVKIEFKNGGLIMPQEEDAFVVHFADKGTELIDNISTETTNERPESFPEELHSKTDTCVSSYSYAQESFSIVGAGVTGEYVEIKDVSNEMVRALSAPVKAGSHISATKEVTDDDEDGIYELELSVTGEAQSSSDTEVNKSNVVIVVDTSKSMGNNDSYQWYEYTYSVDTYDSSAYYYMTNSTSGTRVYHDENGWYYTYGWIRYPYTGTVYKRGTRLEATKMALYSLVDALLENNETVADAMEITLMSFNSNGSSQHSGNIQVPIRNATSAGSTTTSGTLKNAIAQLAIPTSQNAGGTNWEAALDSALDEANRYKNDTSKPNETTSVIFVTDGEPTCSYSNGNGTAYSENVWNDARDDAYNIVNAGFNMYNIFAYGDGSNRLKALTNYAYRHTGNHNNTNDYTYSDGSKTSDHFFDAKNTEELVDAFEAIIKQITNAVGYAGVSYEDGVTVGVTHTSVQVEGTPNPESYNYKVTTKTTSGAISTVYSVKIHNNNTATFTINGVDYTDSDGPETVITPISETQSIRSQVYKVTVGEGDNAKTYMMSPASIDENGLVKWDLAGLGILESGYTYSLTFDVWPNQYSYDLVADLNNGVKTLEQIKEELIAEKGVEAGTALFNQIKNALRGPDEDGQYSILTNYKQEVDYYTADTTTVVDEHTGETTTTTTYTHHDPYSPETEPSIALTSAPLPLVKFWESSLDESQYGNLLWEDYPANTVSKEYRVKLHVWKADTIQELNSKVSQYSSDPASASEHDYLERTLGWKAEEQDYVWHDSLSIAPGTMVSTETVEEMGIPLTGLIVVQYDLDEDGVNEDYYIIESGHYYYVTEDSIDWHFELDTPIYHPMLVDGKLKNVTFVTDEQGNITGVEDIVPMSEVKATNSKTAELDITKVIVDNTGIMTDAQKDAETFTYKITLTVPANADMSHTNAYEYAPNFAGAGSTVPKVFGYQSDENPDVVGLTSEDVGSTGTADVGRFNGVFAWWTTSYPGGGATLDEMFTDENGVIRNSDGTLTNSIYITLRRDEVIRFTNLPSGTKYTIEEIYNNLYQAHPSRDAFANLGDDAPESNIDGKYDVSILTKNGNPTKNGRVVTGTIKELDKRYYNQFTNTVKSNDDLWKELKVKKITEGYTWRNEFYRFFLYAGEAVYSDGKTPATGTSPIHVTNTIDGVDCSRVNLYENTNNHSHEISFGNVLFTRPGTYTYEIRENDNSGNYPHVKFADPVTVTLTVDTGEDGKLHITGVTDNSGIANNSVVNEATSDSLESTTTNMTNRIVPTDVSASKEWLDAAGNVIANDDLPSGIKATFELLADGVATGKTIELDGEVDNNGESDEWIAKFGNVPKYKEVVTGEGEEAEYNYPEIVYTIRENSVSKGFTKVTADPVEPGGVIQNKQQPIKVSLQKIGDANLENLLSDVVFKLYSDENLSTQVSRDALGNNIGGTTDGTITTVNGIADIGSLAVGTYYLVEHVPPSGYNKLTSAIEIYVIATSEGVSVRYKQKDYSASESGEVLYKIYVDGENKEYKVDCKSTTEDPYADNEDYTFVGYRITVNNNSGFELPHTGGSGTLPYTLSGFALMMASVLMYGFRMRRRERRLN